MIKAPVVHMEVFTDQDFERDLAQLERSIQMETDRVARELSIRLVRPNEVASLN